MFVTNHEHKCEVNEDEDYSNRSDFEGHVSTEVDFDIHPSVEDEEKYESRRYEPHLRSL
jgi:hypothetical protein